MKSFNQELKDAIVLEIIKHREQDQIIQGIYGKEIDGIWKGCAVGCAIHSLNLKKGKNIQYSDHSAYENEFGIPKILALLEERIFEELSVENSKMWPENFMSAIPVNSDLSLVWPKFVVWLLTDPRDGVIKYVEKKNIIQDVSDLYLRIISGEANDKSELIDKTHAAAAYAYAAAAAAYADAYADAYAAAAAAYADAAAYAYAAAAYAAAYADAYADASAAAAYAASADAYADASAAYAAYAYAASAAVHEKQRYFAKMADKLIEILKEIR